MRRRKAPERKVLPDPKFGSQQVSRFVNGLMLSGKKSKAEKIFYDAMDIIEAKTKKDPLEIFRKGMENVSPMLEVRSRRVGGATYQVPVEVREKRRRSLAIRWVISYARNRSENTMAEKLASEFMAASNGEGASVKKREDTHKMAEANKAFAHFRW
ncbi:MAG: 30S ribosomal protein S7 [Calditrichia bacterium]